MSYIGGPLPGKERDEEYPQDIGKETFQKGVQRLSDTYQNLPEPFRETVSEVGRAGGELIGGFAEMNREARKSNVLGLGPLDPLIGVTKVYDKAIEGVSAVTGIYRGYFDVADFLIPFTPTALKAAKSFGKAKKVATVVDKVSDVSKGAQFAYKVEQLKPGPTKPLADFLSQDLGEAMFLKNTISEQAYTVAKKSYPLRKINKWNKIITDVTKTGDEMRRASAAFLTSGFGPGDYKQFSKYISKNWGGPITSAITNIHHVGFLEKFKRIPTAHGSFQTIKNAAKTGQLLESPIVMQLRKMGVELGNFAQNTADVLETLTTGSRNFKVDAVFDQFEGTLNRQTIDDMFQGSWMEKGIGDISDATKGDMDAFRSLRKEFPKTKGEVFPQSSIETSTQLKGDKFPTIKIRDPNIPFDRRNPKLGVIEEWKPKDWDEWENRFEIVSEKLGIKNKYNRKAIRIPSKLDIYSNDHSNVHALTELAEKTPGNPVYEAQQAVISGKVKNMDIDKATKLQYNSLNSAEKILGNVLQRRVKKVVELFEELNPGKLFTDLLPEEQQIFFRANVNEIAVKGGFRDKALTLPQALKPVKGDLTLLENIFGFTPQTF